MTRPHTLLTARGARLPDLPPGWQWAVALWEGPDGAGRGAVVSWSVREPRGPSRAPALAQELRFGLGRLSGRRGAVAHWRRFLPCSGSVGDGRRDGRRDALWVQADGGGAARRPSSFLQFVSGPRLASCPAEPGGSGPRPLF